MEKPFQDDDGFYAIWIKWLEPIDLDKHVLDPASKRYLMVNRTTKVHAKGWDKVWASTLDVKVTTAQSGNYTKLASSQKSIIVGRQQSWLLLDKENGIEDPELTVPVHAKPKLRPGQHKPKEKKQPKSRANARAAIPKATAKAAKEPGHHVTPALKPAQKKAQTMSHKPMKAKMKRKRKSGKGASETSDEGRI